MTAAIAAKQCTITVERADPESAILFAAGKEWIGIRAGTIVHIDGRSHAFDQDTSLGVAGTLVPGYDYGVGIHENGQPFATLLASPNPIGAGFFAGFHFAPGGNAEETEGGDDVPAINPCSLWDIGFRPACPDPRGMTLVDVRGGHRFWSDIYLLGTEHLSGTTRCGATIADGRDLPDAVSGKGKCRRLDYGTVVEIYAHHGKRLLGAEEFFAAAYGVKERRSRDEEPTRTGALVDNAKLFISRYGLFDVAGTMWQWGTDGHPDDPRPSLFGGSWFSGSRAGSRCAYLGDWAGHSNGNISARGASDHLRRA